MWLARPGLEGDPSAWRPQPAGTPAPPADSAEAQSHDQLIPPANAAQSAEAPALEKRSEERRVGKSVSVRVDLGGRGLIKHKTHNRNIISYLTQTLHAKNESQSNN